MDLPGPMLRPDAPDGVVGVTFLALPVGARGVYDVDLDIAEVHGLYECVGPAVRAPDGRRRVDGDVLRRVRVADLVPRATAAWLEESGWSKAIADGMVPPRLTPPVAYVDRWTKTRVPPPMFPAEHDVAMARREKEIVEPAKAEVARFRRMVREAARAGGFTRLEAAAAIYKRAQRLGRYPTQAVQKELDITYNAAVGLVRRCRQTEPPLLPKIAKETANAEAASKRRRST